MGEVDLLAESRTGQIHTRNMYRAHAKQEQMIRRGIEESHKERFNQKILAAAKDDELAALRVERRGLLEKEQQLKAQIDFHRKVREVEPKRSCGHLQHHLAEHPHILRGQFKFATSKTLSSSGSGFLTPISQSSP